MFDINVLGPTTVSGYGQRLMAGQLGGNKPRQILELLALEPGRAIAKDQLAEQLWDGRPPSTCIATLESYVCLLRRRISTVSGGPRLLATSPRGYRIDPDDVLVDAVEVRELLVGDHREVMRALDRMSGELLADEPYAGWANEARREFDDVVATACIGAARAARAARDGAAAVRLATEAARRAPFSEPAVRELMRALVEVGARAEAIRVYSEVRERILIDLGMDLEADTRRLFLEILEDDTGERSDQAECLALVARLRRALDANPSILSALPWSRELSDLMRAVAV
jgi:DNA-binding SARP family transcriptional activator